MSVPAVTPISDRNDARLRGIVERATPAERLVLASILRESTDLGGRTPPHDEPAELAVLSAILTHTTAIDEVVDVLPDGAAFYADAHRRIYDAALEVRAKGQPIDFTTVAANLNDRQRLQAVGGMTYLVKIVDATPSVAHVATHARIVAEKARLRQLVDTCLLLAGEAHTPLAANAQQFAQDAAEKVSQIAEVGVVSRVQSVEEIGRLRAEELRAQWRGERDPWGMRGPHERLHALSHGYGMGEQTYLAADTGGGKSVFALQVARHLAGRKYAGETIGCGYFSLEMRSAKHYDRALLQAAYDVAVERRLAPITFRELQTGREIVDEDGNKQALHPDRVAVLDEAAKRVRALPIEFDDAGKDVAGIRSTARLLQRRMRDRGAKLRLLVIDHLHLLELPDARREDEALAKVVASLNDLAKDLELHLLVLCQFNRGSMLRDAPTRSDIRGAAAIEQIAHKIILLHRPWTRMTREQKRQATDDQKREAEAILAKHRDGQEGVVPMDFVGAAFRFDEATDDQEG